MQQTAISIFLGYTFAKEDRAAARALLARFGLEGKLIHTAKGELLAELFRVRMCTLESEQVTETFLAQAQPCLSALNALAAADGGEFAVEIVPEIAGQNKPSLTLGRRFLDFIGGLERLSFVDIDGYLY